VTTGFSSLARTAIVTDSEEFFYKYASFLDKQHFSCQKILVGEASTALTGAFCDVIVIDNEKGSFPHYILEGIYSPSGYSKTIINIGESFIPTGRNSVQCLNFPAEINSTVFKNILALLATTVQREKMQLELSSLLLHDIRSPLNSLIGYLELLISGTFGLMQNGQKNILEKAIDMGDSTLDLIEELSEVFRHEQSAFHLNKKPFSLHDLLETTLSTVWVKADQKNIQIKKAIKENLQQLNGDEYYLQRLLINILTNAVNHSPHNSIITIEVKPNSDKNIEIAVSDQGKGVPEKDLPRLFDKYFFFYQNPKSRKGQGLGLYICKLIAEVHQGHISAYHNHEGGLTISTIIPG
jgi:signal transduction histidine kinase